MKLRHYLSMMILLAVCLYGGSAFAAKAGKGASAHLKHLKGPYPTGLSVTKACLKCHKKAAKEVLSSAHWLWRGPTPFMKGHEDEKGIGKKNLINNF